VNEPTSERDLWVVVGMAIAATSAAVASFSGLRGLAEVAGWPAHLAWLLPVTVDAYAMTSARVWLAGTTRSRRARRFAAANALGAIAGSIAGNAAFHAVSTGLLAVCWPIVVAVGAVPAAVLGLTAHLHALRTHTDRFDAGESGARGRSASQVGADREPGAGSGPEHTHAGRPERRTRSRPGRSSRKRRRYRTEAELMDAARVADRRYRATHGRPITRDALRAALRISGPRATEVRRRLAALDAVGPTSDAPPPPQVVQVADAKEVSTQS
jgi:uncharacterized protein DUF2637